MITGRRVAVACSIARVIEQTIKKKLPEGFQESEFLLEHGQIDMVVERKNMCDMLAKIVAFADKQYPTVPVGEAVELEAGGFGSAVSAAENRAAAKGKTARTAEIGVKNVPAPKAKKK